MTRTGWRKSSRSNGSGSGACVEVRSLVGAMAVRDSKDRRGPVLTVTDREWRAFVKRLQAEQA
jgi:uncharacterized protein DUF397